MPVTKGRNLPGGNSNLLEDLWSGCADGCTSSGGRAISIFHGAPSLKRVLRGSLVSLAITAVYKGETGEAGVRRECDGNSLQMNRPEGKAGHPAVRESLSAKYAANREARELVIKI